MKSLLFTVLIFTAMITNAQKNYEEDVLTAPQGKVKITFIGHGTMILYFNNLVVHVDPWSNLADYSGLPKADLILVTHEHYDHFDQKAIEIIRKPDTRLIYTSKCNEEKNALKGTIMKNGDKLVFKTISIEAIPAYNLVNKRPDGKPFHLKGEGNGYLLTIGGLRIYVAGDTENTPEMKALKNVDVAFLPMNLPYTMTPEMVSDAARSFKPRILYPYHYGDTNTAKLTDLLKGSGIELRIRKMK